MSSLTSSFASNFHFMRATLAQPQPDSQPIYIYFKFTFLFLIKIKLIGRKSSTLQHSHSVPTVQKLLFKRFHRPKELKRLFGSISCGKLCKMLRLIVQWLTLTLLTLLHISLCEMDAGATRALLCRARQRLWSSRVDICRDVWDTLPKASLLSCFGAQI